jgi:arsenite methyltransferase
MPLNYPLFIDNLRMSASQIDIKKEVQNVYGGIAKTKTSCCSCNPSICGEQQIENYSTKLGYSVNEVEQVPDNANLGLGCGVLLYFFF